MLPMLIELLDSRDISERATASKRHEWRLPSMMVQCVVLDVEVRERASRTKMSFKGKKHGKPLCPLLYSILASASF